MLDEVNLEEQFGRFDDHRSPKILASVNDYDVKAVKVQGEFVWHEHQETECPLAAEETRVLLLEPRGTVNTGDAEAAGTVGERLD